MFGCVLHTLSPPSVSALKYSASTKVVTHYVTRGLGISGNGGRRYVFFTPSTSPSFSPAFSLTSWMLKNHQQQMFHGGTFYHQQAPRVSNYHSSAANPRIANYDYYKRAIDNGTVVSTRVVSSTTTNGAGRQTIPPAPAPTTLTLLRHLLSIFAISTASYIYFMHVLEEHEIAMEAKSYAGALVDVNAPIQVNIDPVSIPLQHLSEEISHKVHDAIHEVEDQAIHVLIDDLDVDPALTKCFCAKCTGHAVAAEEEVKVDESVSELLQKEALYALTCSDECVHAHIHLEEVDHLLRDKAHHILEEVEEEVSHHILNDIDIDVSTARTVLLVMNQWEHLGEDINIIVDGLEKILKDMLSYFVPQDEEGTMVNQQVNHTSTHEALLSDLLWYQYGRSDI